MYSIITEYPFRSPKACQKRPERTSSANNFSLSLFLSLSRCASRGPCFVQEINSERASLDEQTIELRPEEDLIPLNTLGYALRVDPTRVRRWIEDTSQIAGTRSTYYFRRDRIEHIRATFDLEYIPASAEEWKQEFLDFAKSRKYFMPIHNILPLMVPLHEVIDALRVVTQASGER
ncbi:MAG TPA: hypothetical protein VGN34_12395 [Ktedonobacteraceae bacterium]